MIRPSVVPAVSAGATRRPRPPSPLKIALDFQCLCFRYHLQRSEHFRRLGDLARSYRHDDLMITIMHQMHATIALGPTRNPAARRSTSGLLSTATPKGPPCTP